MEFTPAGQIVDAYENASIRRRQQEDAQDAQRSAALNQEYAAMNDRNAQSQRALAEQSREADLSQQFRYDQLNQEAGFRERQLALQEGDQALRQQKDATEFYTDPETGQQLELTSEQARSARNLETMAPEDRKSGMRKMLGLSDLVDYPTPDGKVVRVTPQQYATLSQRDDAAQTKQANYAAAQESRAALAREKADLDNQRYELQKASLELQRTNSSADDQRENLRMLFALEAKTDELDVKALQAELNSVEEEVKSRSIQQGVNLSDDPLYPQLVNKRSQLFTGLAALYSRNAANENARKEKLKALDSGTAPTTKPAATKAAAAVQLPPIMPQGKKIRDKETGIVYISDGKTWIPQ